MNKLPLITRVLMGLIFFVFGLNGFLDFMPHPPMPDKAAAFATGLMASGYFFPLLKGVETICGLLLLINMWVPLAIVVLAPVVINIFCFHAFLAPSGLVLPLIIGVLEIYLAFFAKPYSEVIKPLFRRS